MSHFFDLKFKKKSKTQHIASNDKPIITIIIIRRFLIDIYDTLFYKYTSTGALAICIDCNNYIVFVMESIHKFYIAWKEVESNNPWKECWREQWRLHLLLLSEKYHYCQDGNDDRNCITRSDGDVLEMIFVFLYPFLPYLILFVLLNELGRWLARASTSTSTSTSTSEIQRFYNDDNIFAARPTVLAGSFHAVVTATLALYTVLFLPSDSLESSCLWSKVGLPLSISYFIIDIIYYCYPRVSNTISTIIISIPKKKQYPDPLFLYPMVFQKKKSDRLIFLHHIIVAISMYPNLTNSGAAVLVPSIDNSTLSSSSTSIWLSAAGYTAEVSTVLMNYRWYLLETLKDNWWGFGVTNILVVLSWVARVFLFPYLLIVIIIPRTKLYIQEKQIIAYTIVVSTNVIIAILSLYWLSMMLFKGGGIKSLLIFEKKEKDKKTFSFGSDIGRQSITTATTAATTTTTTTTTITNIRTTSSKKQEKEL